MSLSNEKKDRYATISLIIAVGCIAILDCLIIDDMAFHTDYALYFLPCALVILFGLVTWNVLFL